MPGGFPVIPSKDVALKWRDSANQTVLIPGSPCFRLRQ